MSYSRRLAVRAGGLHLEHPVMNASGILSTKPCDIIELLKAGVSAIVTKSFTLSPREGHPTPVIIPVDCGFINSVGLENPGVEGIREVVKAVKSYPNRKPVIISIAPSSPEEAELLARAAYEAGADAIEVNLSCPHAKSRGLDVTTTLIPDIIAVVVERFKPRPVWVKVSALNARMVAEKAFEVGASAVVAINTLPAMKIDVYALRPVLGGVVGGLSGKAIHPIAVRIVYELHCIDGFEVIGVGGVYTWEDAAELILAGAKAVQIGTALFDKGLNVIKEVVEGLYKWLDIVKVERIEDVVGLACRR